MGSMDEAVNELVGEEFLARTSAESFGHVVPSANINVSIIDSGPSKRPFLFTYEHRNSSEMISELGSAISNMLHIIPAGVVCFFPSFSFMDHTITFWKQSMTYNVMKSVKKVVETDSIHFHCVDIH